VSHDGVSSKGCPDQVVTPAKAGVQILSLFRIPAFAGMTAEDLIGGSQVGQTDRRAAAPPGHGYPARHRS